MSLVERLRLKILIWAISRLRLLSPGKMSTAFEPRRLHPTIL